ncbi:MAG: hypothetical protein ACRDRO_09915 [Pseudonocardiaceae bacterium]
MKIAEIFSQGCGSNHGGHRGGYGDSERHYRHEDYYRSYYGGHNGDRYGRHNEGGLLGILGD